MMRVLFWILATLPVFATDVSPVWRMNPVLEKSLKCTEKAEQLYLLAKIPEGLWPVIADGAWGKLIYQDGRFTFNGHFLSPHVEYALIYYPEPWPGDTDFLPTTCLGKGITDEYGYVHIAGRFNFIAIPTVDDIHPYRRTGAKIWLVLAADHDGAKMTAWNPSEYLFEFDLINKK